ncbi:MAG: AAA family ATPase [Proteobacteria bacterium]|nr:AAA family ATPase [Pseudomonadota bacterium]
MNEIWPYPGARWWKFDFHTHTPASKDTNAWQEAIGKADEITPEKWLLKYMEAEIDCVAVTDHNSGAWIDKLKEAYAEMKEKRPEGFRELYLFPGVEITVSSGLHVLALFDTVKTSITITSLLGAVGFPEHLYGETNSDKEAACSRDSLIKVIEEVHRRDGIAIPAHVDADNGILQLEPNTLGAKSPAEIKSILNANLLAIEVTNRNISKPSIYSQSKLRWTEVVGSDCHNFRGNAIPGSRYTWVKMANPPSLEGLRLALLDGDGVSVRRSDDDKPFDPFHKPEHFIESVEIREAHAMGRGKQPAVLRFSPYFNAIVGGRGTGKSTIIHALRLAYQREGELKQFDEKSEPLKTFERFNKVYTSGNKEGGLREDTEIVLTLSRDGVSHRLRWQQNGHGVAVEEDNQPSQSQSITPQRFPLRLFSQGQIAALAGDSQQALLDLIDEAAGTDEEKRGFDDAKNIFLSSKGKLRELEGKLRERDAVNLALQDVQRKLQRFEEADYAEVLKTYQRGSRQTRETNRQFELAAEMAEKLRTLAAELLSEDLPDGLFDVTQDKEALDAYKLLSQAIAVAKARVEGVADNLIGAADKIKTELTQTPWYENLENSAMAYESLKTSLQVEGINDPTEYGRLVQERQKIDTEIKRLDAVQKQFNELNVQLEKDLEGIWNARRAISEKREKFLGKSLSRNPYVSISLQRYMSREPEINDVYEDFPYLSSGKSQFGIIENDSIDEREVKIREFQRILLQSSIDSNGIDQYRSHKGIIRGENKNAIGSGLTILKVSKNASNFDKYLFIIPEDFLDIQYSRKGDGKEFVPITQASAGQRAAAMLAFLLAYGDEPLVLDQPEDDLDNELIYNLVVEQIRANKQRRQLIVVTHNPNIVVNGDAEMLYALYFKNQCYVKESGSLQDKKMREEVCRIMEGGHEAFERRYRRLGREV